jgi:hypothetical protein
MRTVQAELNTALQNSHVRPTIRAEIYPTRIHFNTITSNSPFSGADSVGLNDTVVLQDIAYSATEDKLITFFNNGGTLSYSRQGNSAINSLGVSIDGKPGTYASVIYFISGQTIGRYSIDWAGPTLSGYQEIGTLSTVTDGVPLVVHATGASRCVVLASHEGCLRPIVFSGLTKYACPRRFIFPKLFPTDSPRTLLSLAAFSGAAELGDNVYVYVSNPYKGWVEGINFDTGASRWGDTFIAVPTELQTSLCEFRIANVYWHLGTLYMAGQFSRKDSVVGTQPYSLILSSTDGETFSIDRTTMVSTHGYRFLAKVGGNKLYLGNCNRVCCAPVTYLFDGATGTGFKLDIPADDILSFSTSMPSGSASLTIRAGNEAYMDHEHILSGARIKIFTGYQTSVGYQDVLYSTYVIDSATQSFGDAVRGNRLELMHEARWKLAGLNMPFYTEIAGKSSLYGTYETEGNLYNAHGQVDGRTKFSVDFWGGEPLESFGVDGVNPCSQGGHDFLSLAGVHNAAIKTKELKELLDLEDNPLITGTITANIYGWSRNDEGGSLNDSIRLAIVAIDPDTEVEHVAYCDTPGQWENTWPEWAGGSYPISASISGYTGYRLKHIGVKMQCNDSTVTYVSRVDVTGGIKAQFKYDDTNSGWDAEASGYRLPGYSRPYIMFMQRPYNSFNFQVQASFYHTITTGTNSKAWVGLVGLAEDGQNYIVGRYDQITNTYQIVKVRDGVETVLKAGTGSLVQSSNIAIMFEHRDGRFSLYLRDAARAWVLQGYYDWIDGQGDIYTSVEISPKCGIYGYINSPSFETTGLSMAFDDEGNANTDGVGIMPLDIGALDLLPASGTIRFGDDRYSYTGKTATPSVVRGPFQYRQAGYYAAPYGNENYGLECRHFNWTADPSVLNGYLAAVDSGQAFTINGALWQIYTSTDGVVSYHYNRARYYSLNPFIANPLSTSQRVYVTGGLTGLNPLSTTPISHGLGERACLELNGVIECRWFSGAGGGKDTTVGDLVNVISRLAGARASFPGNTYHAYSSTPQSWFTVGTLEHPEGFDLRFGMSIYLTEVLSNTKIVSHSGVPTGVPVNDTQTRIRFEYLGSGNYTIGLYSDPSNTLLESTPASLGTGGHDVRILYSKNAISIYSDRLWVYTFLIEELLYPGTLTVSTWHESTTLSNVTLHELCDWREAVYIDLETDGQSAIGSIIQERPVEHSPLPDGSIEYYYTKTRTTVSEVIDPRQYSLNKQSALGASCDAIVYGSDEVKTTSDSSLASQIGFSTIVHRFPNMDSGAIRASKMVQVKARQSLKRHNVSTRFDPRLEVGDMYVVSFTASGTGRAISAQIIVEDISVSLDKAFTMTVSGRNYE